jgi:hypothetical protein
MLMLVGGSEGVLVLSVPSLFLLLDKTCACLTKRAQSSMLATTYTANEIPL